MQYVFGGRDVDRRWINLLECSRVRSVVHCPLAGNRPGEQVAIQQQSLDHGLNSIFKDPDRC